MRLLEPRGAPRRIPGYLIGLLAAAAIAAPVATALDRDLDGVDDDVDNCTTMPNPIQSDTDADTIGNVCDPDVNNDCIVDQADLDLCAPLVGPPDPVCDFDDPPDGLVGVGDLAKLLAFLGGPPGPSASGVCSATGVPSIGSPGLVLLSAILAVLGARAAESVCGDSATRSG